MKILVITNMYPGKNSSFGIFVRRQTVNLEKAGINIIKVTKSQRSFFAYPLFIIKSIFYLLFKSYNLVHAHYGFHSALFAAIIKKRPLIITFHGSDALKEPYRNKVYYLLQKFVISRSNYIIAVSNAIKKALVNDLGGCSDKIVVIPCGVDTALFHPMDKTAVRDKLRLPKDRKIVLFVGRLTYWKGIDIVIQCSCQIPNVLFVCIGEGMLKVDLKNCKILGYKPNEEIPLWINAADLFLLPSRSEGTPVALLEALSCGVPAIVSDVGGIPDVITNGENGYLVPTGSINMFRDRISELLSNEMKRKSMGENAARTTIERFDNKKINYKIIRLYKKVINENR